jgi:hypothetical protein
MSQTTKTTMRWNDVLANTRVRDAYRRFANGTPLKTIEGELKNTEHAGPFRRLTRAHGAAKARRLAAGALARLTR